MLENTYKLDPAFNKNLVLAYQPPPSFELSNLPPLTKHWIADLQKKICKADPKLLPNCLDKHLSKASDYQGKNILREQLRIIYHRLQGNLDAELAKLSDDDHIALIKLLTEEINSCTEGFHNRINIVVSSFQQPRNLDELLYIVRKRLVENVATNLSNEVHAWNRVSVIAATDGLGIKANFDNDSHQGSLKEARIRQALQLKFATSFTPILLPILLISVFKELVPELEIEKQSETGIGLQTQEKINSLLKQFLPEYINENSKDPNNWENYFEKEVNKNEPWLFKFVDINCEKLYQSFYFSLLKNNYFTKPKINTLIENANYNLFLNDSKFIQSPEAIIKQLFSEQQYYSLISQLTQVQEKYPIFYTDNIYTHLNIERLFIKNCSAFNQFLTNQLKVREQNFEEILVGFQLIFHLNIPGRSTVIGEIANSLLVTNKAHFNLLMLGALHNLELVKNIFAFLKKYEPFIGSKIAENMLLMKNRDNCNALMIAANKQKVEEILLKENQDRQSLLRIAANKQKEAITAILGFLNTHIGRFANDTLCKLFTQQQIQDSNTALTLAARDNPDLLSTILGFFTEHLKIDNETFRRLLFPSKGTCTALMLAIKNQADSSLSILNFISKNLRSFDQEVLRKIFLEKDENNFNILMLAARYYPKALTTLLNLLNERKLFPEEFLTSLFLEKNSQRSNFLMLAAEHQPQAVTVILEFFNKKRKIFNPYLIKLLFDKNDHGYNSLMLSHEHPEIMMSMILFICRQPKIAMPLTLLEIFLMKNIVGLNLLMLLAKNNIQSLNLLLEFIERNPDHFTKENLLKLFQEKTLLGYNCLMIAARNQYATTEAILNFIIKKPKIFSPQFIVQYIVTLDCNRTNALMIAAIHQPENVALLLDFLTQNVNPRGPIPIETIKEIVFEKFHDKIKASNVLFGGRFGYYRSVLQTTWELSDPTAVNALLKFIDHHIDLFGIETFTDLLTETDYDNNPIFSPACSQYPGILKKTLNLIANLATHEKLVPLHNVCAQLIFEQLARWTIQTTADQKLFEKVLEKCSSFLLTNFNKDFFAESPENLKRVTDKLFAYYLYELKNDSRTNRYYFYLIPHSKVQELKTAESLENIIKKPNLDKSFSLVNFQKEHSISSTPSPLNSLFAAYLEIAQLQSYEAYELDIENDDVCYNNKINLAA